MNLVNESQSPFEIHQNLHIHLLSEDEIDEQGIGLFQTLKKHYRHVHLECLNCKPPTSNLLNLLSNSVDICASNPPEKAVILYKKFSKETFQLLQKHFSSLVTFQAEDTQIFDQAWSLEAIWHKKLIVLYLPFQELQIKHIWSFLNQNSSSNNSSISCTSSLSFKSHIPPPMEKGEYLLSGFLANTIVLPESTVEIKEAKHEEISLWSFTPMQSTLQELLNVAYTIFILSGTLAMLSIDRGIFKQFLCAIQQNYHRNPYHNFHHAVDSLQSAFNLYKQIGFTLKPLHLFALLIACLGHDLQHPGHNNVYLSKSNSALDAIYCGNSVLEHYHSCILFEILRKKEYNFLSHFSHHDFQSFRKIVLQTILSTDMALHYDYVTRLNSRIALLNERPIDLVAEANEDVFLFVIGLMKCADISNVARPQEIACEWANLLIREFFLQGEREKSCGFSVSFLCDANETNLPASQIGFIRDVAIPFYNVFDKLVGNKLGIPLGHMESNLEFWKSQSSVSDSSSCPSLLKPQKSTSCSSSTITLQPQSLKRAISCDGRRMSMTETVSGFESVTHTTTTVTFSDSQVSQ